MFVMEGVKPMAKLHFLHGCAKVQAIKFALNEAGIALNAWC